MEFRYASVRRFDISVVVTKLLGLSYCVFTQRSVHRSSFFQPFLSTFLVLATTENETHACKCKIPFHARITFHKLNFSEKCKEE